MSSWSRAIRSRADGGRERARLSHGARQHGRLIHAAPFAAQRACAPVAIVNAESEAIVAVGAIIADIPMVDRVDIAAIRDGDWVTVDDGTLVVTRHGE